MLPLTTTGSNPWRMRQVASVVAPLALLLVLDGCHRTESGQARLDESGGTTAVGGASGSGTADRAAGATPRVSGTGGGTGGGTSGTTPGSQSGVRGPAWASWPIPSPPATGAPHPQDYDTSNKAVVLDRVTGRMWQRFADPRTIVWSQARDTCDGLDLGGYSDWRLPSRIELVSIVDLTHSQPSINQAAFPKAPSDWFWTSSADADNPTAAAWYVYFYFGYPKTDLIGNQFRVRCVRATKPSDQAEPLDPNYDVQKEIVRDRGTGLAWQRVTPAQSFDFEGARQYCMKLRLGHQRGWRVPSAGELLTLVDERRTNPTIDVTAFPNTPSQSFWTSSLFADSPAMAWHVYFEYGNSLYGLLKGLYRVRCVR
jgi:hypothetical protein